MTDGWFPRLSPSGRRVMRGSEVLSVDGVALPNQPEGGISGAWCDEDTVVYRTHRDPGKLLTRRLGGDLSGEDAVLAGPTSWVSAGGGVVAWCEAAAGGTPRIVALGPGGRREWVGYGGGWAPVHVAFNGWVFFGHHERGGLYWVPPGEQTPVLLTALPARLTRSSRTGITWEANGRVYVADWATLEPRDVTLPGEVEHGPVLVDTPAGPWMVTHTDRRLLVRPLGRTTGVVLDESGDTFYPDAAWWPGDDARPPGVRVCWSQGQGPKDGPAGTPHDRVVPLAAPLVDLLPAARWFDAGTLVDLMPFVAASYTGVLRCPEDGQTLQTVRLPDKVIACLKGAPERQERWRYDDNAVYLTYDATDGREGRPWRIAPEPVWCRRLWPVGAAWHAPAGTRLVRRTLDGRSEAHPFPVRTRLHAAGEHVEVRGIGRCRVAVTTWEPGWPDSGYEERHWWAIRESDGVRLGRVRYEEWRRGALERAFDFFLSDVPPLRPAEPLAIPDPVETPDLPETPDTPDRPEMPDPTIQPPPRDDVLECLTWLRHEVYPGLVGHPLDDEGIAAWLVDTYTVDGRLRRGLSHEAALHATFAAIERVVRPSTTPEPSQPPIPVPPRPEHGVPPRQGRLVVDDAGYRDDHGRRLPFYIHAGDLCSRFRRDPGGATRLLDEVVALGADGVRTWTWLINEPFWSGRTLRGEWEALRAFVAACKARNLRLVLSQGDLWQAGHAAARAWLVDLAGFIATEGPEWFDFVDAGNETWHNGCDDPAVLAAALRPLATAGPILTLTDVPEGGDLAAWSQAPARVLDLHSQFHDPDGCIRRTWNGGYETKHIRPYRIESEPRGWGRNVTVCDRIDRSAQLALAAAAWISGAAYVAMSSPGVISDGTKNGRFDAGESFLEMPGFSELAALRAWLPADVMSWTRVHGGARDGSLRVWAVEQGNDDCRADHAIAADGRYVCVMSAGRSTQVREATVEDFDTSLGGGRRIVRGRLR